MGDRTLTLLFCQQEWRQEALRAGQRSAAEGLRDAATGYDSASELAIE